MAALRSVPPGADSKPPAAAARLMPRGLLLVFAAFCVAACGSVSEAQRYERENRRVIVLERYEARRAACQAAGGVMVLSAQGGLNDERDLQPYQNARCVMPDTL